MTESDRQELRNWFAAGMPDHPIFTSPDRAAAEAKGK